MTIPNFFIVGAPKCGTTALFQYLCEHDAVVGSEPKEPHYFATDLPGQQTISDKAEYLALFKHVNEATLATGEASVWYLLSKEALSNIKVFNPDARIIVMFRNPVDLVYSMHSQNVFVRDDDEEDFSSAWRLCDARRAGKKLPKHMRDLDTILYDELAMLGDQLSRVYALFPHEQVRVIFYEDFATDTAAVYQDTLDFLDVPTDGRTTFERINQNKKHNNRVLADFIERPPEFLTRPYLKLKKLVGLEEKSLGALEGMRSANSSKTHRAPLSPNLRAEIAAHYRSDIQKLASLTGRDLSHWHDDAGEAVS